MRKIYLCIVIVSLTFSVKLIACTGALLSAQDNSIVTGRTVEFATPLQMHLAVVPRNYSFTGQTANGAGLSYQSKYAYTGVYCFNNQLVMDGINEQGLTVGAFFFPGYAQYTPLTSANQSQALSPVDFPNWILSQFATIDEVQSALSSIVVVPTVVSGWGNSAPPFHYIVYDSNGQSLVIEPTGGELVTFQNPLGSFTNSPTFDWHLTNLDQYIKLSPMNAMPLTIRQMTFQSYGQGSGMLGIPGDFTSPSRFIRSTMYSSNMIQPTTATQLPNQLFHLLNQFDIPYGVVRDQNQSSVVCDFTQLTTVKDPNTLRYYYRSYGDQTIRYVNLSQFNPTATTIKSMVIQGNQQNVNASNFLQ